MLSEGADAPGFELPAVVDGEKRRVALSEYLGDDVVILAFYPADFNPACDAESCDLDELDLFTMQKDVTILGISPDSVYSHGAFAREYDLKIPLLADTDGEVAERYDIGLVDDIGQRLVERAVAVVDHDGAITYSWSTDDMTELPRVEEIKDALAETGGDDTAFARYRVGHAHYTEGRRAFTSAMESFQNTEWVMAQHDFQQAREEFEEAADRFDTAVRFVDDGALVPIYEGANEKATALWQAADWLTRSASAYSSGSGSKGQELREDAEIPMSTVREYREPPDPDGEWPPEMENLEKAESDDHSILPTEPEVEDTALELDIDEADTETDDEPAPEPEPDESTDSAEQVTATAEGGDTATDDDIDDDELAEIQAELAANSPDSEPSVEELTEESTSIVDAPPMGASDGESEAGEAVDGEVEAVGETPESSTVDTPATDEPAGDTVSADERDEPADDDSAGESDVDAPTAGDEAEAADDAAVEEVSTGSSSGEPAVTADDQAAPAEQTDASPAVDADSVATDQSDGADDSASAMATDGSDDAAAGETDGTDAAGSGETDAGESGETDASGSDDADDDGPDLQLELAEPDPDPIDGDGPPIPPAEESDGESSSDE